MHPTYALMRSRWREGGHSCRSGGAQRCTALPQPAGSIAPPRRAVLPYLLDLESTNFSYLNGERVLPARYTELRAKDVLRFGESSREFVLLFDELVQ